MNTIDHLANTFGGRIRKNIFGSEILSGVRRIFSIQEIANKISSVYIERGYSQDSLQIDETQGGAFLLFSKAGDIHQVNLTYTSGSFGNDLQITEERLPILSRNP